MDVLVKHSNGLQELRTAIECKYWSVKVDKTVIAKLSGIIEDAGIEKGVVVSNEGFTPDAITFAKYKNIGLVELRELNDADWEGYIKAIHVTMRMETPEFYDLEILQDTVDTNSRNKQSFNPVTNQATIHDPIQGVRTLLEILQTEHNKGIQDGQPIEVNFSPGTILKINGDERRGEITGIRFKVRFLYTSKEFTVDAAEQIYLIMKDLFGKREFTLNREGQLTEQQETEHT